MNIKLLPFYALGGAIGGFVGALVGSYVADRWFNDDYKKDAEEVIEVEPMTWEEAVEEESQPEKLEKKKVPEKKEKRDYARIYKSSKEELTLEELEHEAAKYKNNSSLGTRNNGLIREEQKVPRIISEEEFYLGDENLKLTYTYYSQDDTLADENEEIVPNRGDILGQEALKSFGRGGSDPDTVYVYSPGTSTKYEITRLRNSYQQVVLGQDIEEEPIVEEKPAPRKVKTPRVSRRHEDN